MWASDSIKKFALIGTSCSGKTTLVYSILAHLKQLSISCDGVTQQDRRFAFDRPQLEKYKEAQYYFICNQIMRETELTLRHHAPVLVSDRSVLDLYAWYEVTYGRSDPLLSMVLEWCKTYEQLYYLHPLPYEDDKQRPPDNFRLRAADVLERHLLPLADNVSRLDRTQVLDDIMKRIGHKLKEVDLEQIPEILNVPCILLGGSYAFNRATKYSDVDVYILTNGSICVDATVPTMQALSRKVQAFLGVKVEVNVVTPAIWEYLQTQKFRLIYRKG